MSVDTLTITRPDDWHLHLRDGAALASLVTHTAQRFGRAVVMPNLKPPVTTLAAALAYRERILATLPPGSDFEPLMTLYLTDTTSAAEIRAARQSGQVIGVKLYPAGATTNSAEGVTNIEHCYPALEAMSALDLPLLVHGEVVDPAVDIFDREQRFIETVLGPVTNRFPNLRIVFEHITTADAVQFVRAHRPRVAATITPQHILLNRNALFAGGLRPHHYCLPVLKAERHRQMVLAAATSGESGFFLGTDSAPHARGAKESSCGCAGVFSAHAGIELYAEAFDACGRLDRLEAFASRNGPEFYRLPANAGSLILVRQPWTVPASYPLGDAEVVPFRAGADIAWRISESGNADA